MKTNGNRQDGRGTPYLGAAGFSRRPGPRWCGGAGPFRLGQRCHSAGSPCLNVTARTSSPNLDPHLPTCFRVFGDIRGAIAFVLILGDYVTGCGCIPRSPQTTTGQPYCLTFSSITWTWEFDHKTSLWWSITTRPNTAPALAGTMSQKSLACLRGLT